MRDLIGSTLGHYRIVDKIGEGGMGEVYRARDERLDRDVAVKVLPASVAQDPERIARFEREAKAVAKLEHPNIVAIHDFDNEGDVTFAVTELLEGETLREQLQKSRGPLPWRQVQEISAAVANGLGAAHGKGVVHRDIKPSNIFLCSDGRVKILDFGLAATHEVVASEAETGSLVAPLTRKGSVMGTVGYMSPEQVRGEPADHRSDIFALGCVLYEMLTGHRAFKRDTTAEIMTAILREEPPSFTESGVQVVPEVAKAVQHCLEKNPEHRFQSAADVAFALGVGTDAAASPVVERETPQLRNWAMPLLAIAGILIVAVAMFFGPGILERLGGHSEQAPIRSIAILPLENLTGDPEQVYFVDGLHNELIATFAQISGFDKVIARTSVMGFKDSDTPIREIGKQLGVAAVIEGSVRRSGEMVRVTIQLIDAHTEQILLADNFDRDLRDILELQCEVASTVVNAVSLSLSQQEETRLARSDRVNKEAYEAYLMGTRFMDAPHVEENLIRAAGFFRLSIEKDPGFSRAHAGLAGTHVRLSTRFRPPSEEMPQALASALKAIELDNTLGEAYAWLGDIKATWQWDWAGADAAFQKALELQPNSPSARRLYSQFLVGMMRFDEAVLIQQRAVELAPLSRDAQVSLGWVYWATRQYETGASYLEAYVDRYPDAVWGRLILSWTYALMGRISDSVVVAEQARDLHPAPNDDPFLLMTLASAYGFAGRIDENETAQQRLHQLRRTSYIPAPYLAFGYVATGDTDAAFEWLQKTCEERHGQAMLLQTFVAMRPSIGEDPRIQDLIESMHFPENFQ